MTTLDNRQAPLVFAAAPYLNSAPLTDGMHGRDDVRVITDVPSALAACLAAGHADAALVPVVDLIFDPGLTMIPGLGIGADGKVCSVVLRCSCPANGVRTLMTDPSSHTSNLLAQLVLRAHFGAGPLTLIEDTKMTADAAVIIGDRAIESHAAVAAEYDLGEVWHTMTELPFVFAVWAYRRGHPRAAELECVAKEAYAVGVVMIDAIAARSADRLGLPEAMCREYLSHCIRYTIGDRELRGIDEFRRLLNRHGLAPAGERTI